MHGLSAGRFTSSDDFFDHKIGLGGGRRADMDGLISHLNMQRVFIRIRINGYRFDPHPARGLDDATRNFTAIGDQYFLEHSLPRPARLCHFDDCSRGKSESGKLNPKTNRAWRADGWTTWQQFPFAAPAMPARPKAHQDDAAKTGADWRPPP